MQNKEDKELNRPHFLILCHIIILGIAVPLMNRVSLTRQWKGTAVRENLT